MADQKNLRDSIQGLASVGDEVVSDAFADAYGYEKLTSTTQLINIDDLPGGDDDETPAEDEPPATPVGFTPVRGVRSDITKADPNIHKAPKQRDD